MADPSRCERVPAGGHDGGVFAVDLQPDAVLRPLEPWRAPEFLTNLDRCRDYIAPWVGPSFVATDLASARAVLQRYADSQARDTGLILGIWLADRLVGGVMVVSMDTTGGTAEVGCWLEPSATGRGLITQAATHLIDWLVRGRGIHRVEWQTLAANEPSIKVARRLGMTRDGVLRAAIPPRGSQAERQDLEIWSILAPEWEQRPRV